MKLKINGLERQVTDARTVEQLLRFLGIPPDGKGTAVARNDAVVPRGRWAETRIEDGDRIEIITAVQGG